MSTWIVTGGAGFIGSNFARLALKRTEAQIVVLDKLTYAGNLRTVEDLGGQPRFQFVHGDICDRSMVREIIEEHNPTAILNFAAESHVDRSIDGPRAFIESNTVGTFELLEASREYLQSLDESKRESFRFLQVSTDEVYGTLGKTGLFSETTAYAPNSPYAASKASADHLARAYFETFDISAIITNCSNNYGPYQYPEKLVPLTILSAVEGLPLPIYGDGSNIRDWIQVKDHCEGVLAALQKGRPGERYNIGADNERTNIQVVDSICIALEELRPAAENDALKKKGVKSYAALKTFVKDRPGHDKRYAIDASKVRKELGWQPSYNFEKGLKKTVQWYLDNVEWCEAAKRGRYEGERLGKSAVEA